jgi:magnesium transporter
VADGTPWVALVDPTEDEVRAHLREDLHPAALALLFAPLAHDTVPRPRIESHGNYVVGVLVIPVAVPRNTTIYYQEVDFVLTRDQLVTVSKTPPGGRPFEPTPAMEACQPGEEIGMQFFRLVDYVAEGYLDLIDTVNDEIDELEDHVEDWRSDRLRTRISTLRHDLLHIRRTLTPTRDAVHRIVDDRIELDDFELFPREVELYFADAYDKFLRATEGLETSRDLVAGVREYFQAKIAIDQNEVMKRLTMVASLLLLPTFIVGLYGQNFHNMPELAWHFGYGWSWFLIIITTIGQIAFFRWKRWL